MTQTDLLDPETGRPIPPRRFAKELPSVVVIVAGFVLGGATATVLQGVLWGLIAAATLIGAIWLSKERLTQRQQAVLSAGVVASTVLSTLVLPDVPESVGVVEALKFAAAWSPAGVASAAVLMMRGSSRSSAFNVAVAWVGAGAFTLPAAVTFDVLAPLESLIGDELPSYGGGIFAFAGLVVGLVGGAAVLGAATRLPIVSVLSGVAFVTLYAGAQVGFSPVTLIRDLGNVNKIPNYWPPDYDWAIGDTGNWWWLPSWEFGSATRVNPIIETFRIAIIAAVLGCSIALPVAFLASRLTAPNNSTYLIDKGFMNLIRTMPDLFWALIFVTAIGIGPFAGALALVMFSLAIMAKLLSETVDAADPGPLEAAKATGSPHFPAIRSSVLPQVLPNYVAYALYIFEINVRASVVIGLVGAGGIGLRLEEQRAFFRFDRVMAIITVVFVLVLIIEQISVALRRRLV